MSLSRRRMAGFTLIELLVVITIIAILIALLLPAVQAIRAAARTMQCSNNMKNVALAVHSYESINKLYPSGYNGEALDGSVIHGREGWPQQLLPHLEVNALYDSYKADTAGLFLMWLPQSITGVVIPSLCCPGDGFAPGRGGSGGGAFQGSYAFCNGDRAIDLNDSTARGIIAAKMKVKVASVTDGLTNTVFGSEGIIRGSVEGCWGEIGGYWGGGPHGSLFFTTMEPPNTSLSDYHYQCKSLDFPNAPCVSTTGSTAPINYARSHHSGGVNAFFGDGAVKMVSDSTDVYVWRALGTRGQGEAAGLGSF